LFSHVKVLPSQPTDLWKCSKFSAGSPAEKWATHPEWMNQYIERFGAIHRDIRYFTYLVDKNEVENKHVLKYHRDDVAFYLDFLDNFYAMAEKTTQGSKIMERFKEYHERIPALKKMWEHLR
jgi:hypothetical protein